MQSNNHQILIVDDDYEMRIILSRALEMAGYRTQQAASGEEALYLLTKHNFDLILLDLKMPRVDGIEIMQWVQEKKLDVEIIVITAAPTLDSAITALRQNAADYLKKPVTMKNLIDSVNLTLHRRLKRMQQEKINRTLTDDSGLKNGAMLTLDTASEIHLGNLRLDRSLHTFHFLEDEESVQLTRGETAVLSGLMSFPGRVLSCAELAQKAWGYDIGEEEAQSIIRPYIFRLRKKLEPSSNVPKLIVTVRGSGYYFNYQPPEKNPKQI